MPASTRYLLSFVFSGLLLGCSLQNHHPATLPENFRQLSGRIYSSGEPSGSAAFRALERAGIKTVVSVDGAAPDVVDAKKCSLAYVHLPIGYDGVPPATIVALDRVLKSTAGKILIHCHHGRHRGPAAAVIAAMIEGSMNNERALATLKEAGTSPDYTGLWRDVREFRSVPATVQAQSIVEKASIDPLADSMVRIDHAFERIEKLLGSASPVQSSLSEQAVLLDEGFREAIRAGKNQGHPAPLQVRLARSGQMSADLAKLIKASDFTQAKLAFSTMKAECRACHARYRN